MKENLKEKKGITLIALIITIIVMLILVVVTINLAVNGGLFTYAGNASRGTKKAKEDEQTIASGIVGGKTIDEWVNGGSSLLPNSTIPAGGVYLRMSTYPPTSDQITAYYSEITDTEKTSIIDFLSMRMGLEGATFEDLENGGENVPEGLQDFDMYFYGDYGYIYYNVTTEYFSLEGWAVVALDTTKESYGEILNSINGEELKYLFSTFLDCANLITAPKIPNSVTSIEGEAFVNCTSLRNITIPNSVTSIGESAFVNCTSLTSITIPNSVTNIGECAFGICTSLTSITYQGTKSQWKSITKDAGWNYNSSISTIVCTDGDVSV